MDVEVQAVKDHEIKELIRRSQQGDQQARDEIIEKICGLFGRLCSGF